MHGKLTQELLDSSVDLRFTRQGVSWDEYERVLAENRTNSSPRFTYDRGTLEIARLTAGQEETNCALAFIVGLAAPALRIDIRDLGARTCRRWDLQRGFDPDSSFSIQGAARTACSRESELLNDPPPDLVIDIAAHGSLKKLPIFAAFGVPEIWQYREATDHVSILRLRHGHYHERRESAALVPLTSDMLTDLVRQGRGKSSPIWHRELRSWLEEYD